MATNSRAGQGKSFVERIYRLRIAGLGLGFFCVASVFALQHRGFVLWSLLVFHGFVWPHVARRAALACEVPFRGLRQAVLLRQAAHEVAHTVARLREAAFELRQPGLSVLSDAALIGGGLLMRLGTPLALMACGQAGNFKRVAAAHQGRCLAGLHGLLHRKR